MESASELTVGDDVRVRVQLAMTGEDLGSVTCKLQDTVGAFKCMVEQHFGQSGPWQVLLNSVTLSHDQTLELSCVKTGDILQLVRVSQLLFASLGPSLSCSPINEVSEDSVTVKSTSEHGGSLFGSTLLEPALTMDVAFAWVSFRVTESKCGNGCCGGVNGLYFGITLADHDIKHGFAACGASTTFMYRCRDGDKRIKGQWQPFNKKCRGRGGSMGSYFEGDEITLEYNRDAGTLRVKDLHGWCEQPLTDALPKGCTLHLTVDACEKGQGATIVCSGFRSVNSLLEEQVQRPPPMHVFASSACSPSNTISEDGLTVRCTGPLEGDLAFGCTLLEPAIKKDATFAQVTFRMLTSIAGFPELRTPSEYRAGFQNGGVNGLYLGITLADHDIAGGRAACGEDTSFVYRCRDGDKRVGGVWQRFKAHRGKPDRHSQGAYFQDDEITLTFDGMNRTLSMTDRDGLHPEPLVADIPEGRDFYFCVDTREPGQGATIVTSSWQ